MQEDQVRVSFGYTEPAVIETQGRDGPVEIPIERAVSSIVVDRATGIVLEQTRDAGGGQASYQIRLVDSSIDVR